MATPLTDSINALTTYANEVTGLSDTTLSDAVHTLASGYGQGGGSFDFFENCFTEVGRIYFPMFDGASLPNELTLHLKKCTSLSFVFNKVTGGSATKLNIVLDNPITGMEQAFNGSQIGEINIDGDLSHVTTYNSMFSYGSNTLKPLFDIDFTSVTTSSGAVHTLAWAQDYLRYVPNTLKVSQNLNYGNQSQALTTESAISVANGLNETVSGLTLTLKTAIRNQCNTIIGDSIYDSEHGYHLFVENPSGAMSLTDFITNVKGWTLA